jgi:survival-of-motor-neuron-related-splicing factor 30
MSMSDARSQLAEIEALIAASPDDPSLQALKDDLLQLIALEEQASSDPSAVPSPPATEQQHPPAGAFSVDLADQNSATNIADYTAKGKFTSHATSIQSSLLEEAPDISAFQPVTTSSKAVVASRTADNKSQDKNGDVEDNDGTITTNQSEKKKKKKKKDDDADMKFELPPHLIPLDSDTPAQKLKKQRTAKALKSKFREKQKEMEADKKKNDWKSFAKGGKRKAVGGIVGNSIFSTEEGVNAKVGVVSGGGTRKMTEFLEKGGNKRHKFL